MTETRSGIQHEIRGVRKPTQDRIPGLASGNGNGSRSTAAGATRTPRANSSPSPALRLSCHWTASSSSAAASGSLACQLQRIVMPHPADVGGATPRRRRRECGRRPSPSHPRRATPASGSRRGAGDRRTNWMKCIVNIAGASARVRWPRRNPHVGSSCSIESSASHA